MTLRCKHGDAPMCPSCAQFYESLEKPVVTPHSEGGDVNNRRAKLNCGDCHNQMLGCEDVCIREVARAVLVKLKSEGGEMKTTPISNAEKTAILKGMTEEQQDYICDISSQVVNLERELAQLQSKLEALEAWKESYLSVEASWDCQAVAKAIGLPPGHPIRPKILPAILELQSKLAEAERQRKIDIDLITVQQWQNEQLRDIREWCIKSLVRATGFTRDDIEDGPMTCAVKHAKRIASLESKLAEAEREAGKGWKAFYELRKQVAADKYPDLTNTVYAKERIASLEAELKTEKLARQSSDHQNHEAEEMLQMNAKEIARLLAELKTERENGAKLQPLIDAAIVWAYCPHAGSYADGPSIEDTCEALSEAVQDHTKLESTGRTWTVDEMHAALGGSHASE